METLAEAMVTLIVAIFVIFGVGALVLALGVWFGLFVLVPRIQRAIDRSEADEEEPGDRPD